MLFVASGSSGFSIAFSALPRTTGLFRFFVDADQLSALVYGTQYHAAPGDPPPLIAPFGSGCMELVPFQDLSIPQAALGATDIAMRRHLPPETLAVTVTRPMFRRLCSLDEHSFLYKPFLRDLNKARASE